MVELRKDWEFVVIEKNQVNNVEPDSLKCCTTSDSFPEKTIDHSMKQDKAINAAGLAKYQMEFFFLGVISNVFGIFVMIRTMNKNGLIRARFLAQSLTIGL